MKVPIAKEVEFHFKIFQFHKYGYLCQDRIQQLNIIFKKNTYKLTIQQEIFTHLPSKPATSEILIKTNLYRYLNK